MWQKWIRLVINTGSSEDFWETLYNKTAIVDDNAPAKFRPGDTGTIISLVASDQEMLIEFGDGHDLTIPLRFLSLLES